MNSVSLIASHAPGEGSASSSAAEPVAEPRVMTATTGRATSAEVDDRSAAQAPSGRSRAAALPAPGRREPSADGARRCSSRRHPSISPALACERLW